MYWNDHNPPHFHAEYGDYEVLIEINNLSLYSGYFPSRALGLGLEWASQQREELRENWILAQQRFTPNRIEPLK